MEIRVRYAVTRLLLIANLNFLVLTYLNSTLGNNLEFRAQLQITCLYVVPSRLITARIRLALFTCIDFSESFTSHHDPS